MIKIPLLRNNVKKPINNLHHWGVSGRWRDVHCDCGIYRKLDSGRRSRVAEIISHEGYFKSGNSYSYIDIRSSLCLN